MSGTVFQTNFENIKLKARGKVRDVYNLGDELLIVATDRISAFDVVMAEPIPGKGRILTAISAFWFKALAGIVPDHLISLNPDEYPESCRPYRDILAGRSMLVKKAEPLPVECIVRGYLAGSGYKDYLKTGQICGIRLPRGLQEASRLDEPIFAPSTKAERGEHDQNITMAQVRNLIGADKADRIASVSLKLYSRARDLAEARGIILADTKFEFGLYDGEIILIDEIFTPDSSRFWPKDRYQPGRAQPSFDKQPLRDYLETLDWNKMPPPPPLPAEVISATVKRYQEAERLLTGGQSG